MADPADDHGFPWELQLRPGAELVGRWSLPDAAGNPLFGLPPLPERDLPESPFRGLGWFTAGHAEVFFGRGHQVRELYKLVDRPRPAADPATTAPRAWASRRCSTPAWCPAWRPTATRSATAAATRSKGLLGTLLDAFPASGDGQARELCRGLAGRGGAARNRPLVVILDQVEEAFTRPRTPSLSELDDFVDGPGPGASAAATPGPGAS